MNRYIYFYLLGFFLLASCGRDPMVINPPEASEVYITEDMTIEEGDSWVLDPGTRVIISPGVTIVSFGDIFINGTEENPVILEGSDPDLGWERIQVKGPAQNLIIHNAIIRNGRITSFQTNNDFQNVTFINNQILEWNDAMARFWGGKILIENCRTECINRGEGFLVHDANRPVINNCIFMSTPDAIEYINCFEGEITNNHFENCNDDAIDNNFCVNTLIENNAIYFAADCGMELGSENFGSSTGLIVNNNLIVGCAKGIIVKESSDINVTNCTFYDNLVGVEVHTSQDSSRASTLLMSNSILAEHSENIKQNENTIANVKVCLSDNALPEGDNNVQGSVLFADPDNNDFRIISNLFPLGTSANSIGYQSP